MIKDIKIANPGEEKLLEMEQWLRENIGPGSMRTIKNGFMGMDDWFYYEDLPDWPEDDENFVIDNDDDDAEPNLIFTFRRDSDATIFALKWTTQLTH